ncbi:MAG TPA: FCD domain-containing protein [Spirillospora sp.]|nr:FCD domain-containing protein [Spirillospora sp.]
MIRWQFANRDDQAFLQNLAEVRGIIEPQAARYAAQRRTPDDLAVLDDALAAMKAADGDPDRAEQAMQTSSPRRRTTSTPSPPTNSALKKGARGRPIALSAAMPGPAFPPRGLFDAAGPVFSRHSAGNVA